MRVSGGDLSWPPGSAGLASRERQSRARSDLWHAGGEHLWHAGGEHLWHAGGECRREASRAQRASRSPTEGTQPERGRQRPAAAVERGGSGPLLTREFPVQEDPGQESLTT